MRIFPAGKCFNFSILELSIQATTLAVRGSCVNHGGPTPINNNSFGRNIRSCALPWGNVCLVKLQEHSRQPLLQLTRGQLECTSIKF
ncbi:hypothetical protein Trydic_g1593 [Trypoxylus dichotomus]